MNRFFKYSLVISIIIVLIAGLIIFAITLYDPNTYKPLITQWVKDEKKRELRLDGDIRLTLYPQFGLNISQISLSEYDSREAFAHIKNIQLSLSLWPLLNKQLVVDKLAIQDLMPPSFASPTVAPILMTYYPQRMIRRRLNSILNRYISTTLPLFFET